MRDTWASFQRKAGTRARVCVTRGGSGPPPEQLAEPRAHEGPDRHVEVPDPSAKVRMARGGPGPTCGGPGPRLQVLSISTSGTRGDTGPVPEREAGLEPLIR